MRLEIGEETKTDIVLKKHPFGKKLQALCGLEETIEMHKGIISCVRNELKADTTFIIYHNRNLTNGSIMEIFKAEMQSILQGSKEELQQSINNINNNLNNLI